MTDAEAQLEGFIARFSDDVAGQALGILGRMRARLPGAVALVYDNYNALAVGFCASEKPSSLVLSVAVYPNWVSLFFVGGPGLDDPHGLLKGEGGRFRHLVLREGPATLEDPRVCTLVDQALARTATPIDPTAPSRLKIQSISARQRPMLSSRQSGGSDRLVFPAATTINRVFYPLLVIVNSQF